MVKTKTMPTETEIWEQGLAIADAYCASRAEMQKWEMFGKAFFLAALNRLKAQDPKYDFSDINCNMSLEEMTRIYAARYPHPLQQGTGP